MDKRKIIDTANLLIIYKNILGEKEWQRIAYMCYNKKHGKTLPKSQAVRRLQRGNQPGVRSAYN